jgi:hypothetical protein
MKKLQIVFGAIVMMLLFTVNATAQETKGAVGARAVTNNMKEELSLNDSQYTKVYAVNLEYLQKAIENKESGKSKVEKAKRMKVLDDDRDNKLKSVLSDDQYKKYVANKVENRKKLREHFESKKE